MNAHNKNRVVITGMGIVAPNAVGVPAFEKALQEQTSGIRFDPQLADLNFGCQVSGTPQITEELLAENFTNLQLRGLKATGLVYGVIAGKEAFKDAGLEIAGLDVAMKDMGIIFGTGQSGGEKFREAILLIDQKKVRRLGSTSVIQTMTSGISAWLAGELGCGNLVTSNSSACCTGTEAFLMGYERIAAGKATQMLVGSTSDSGPYIWGGFDAMRILPTKYNETPEKASRPISCDAAGFVPGSGAGAFILESLESALKRGAKIYGEVLGGALNSGGHRGDGSMTAPNGQAVQDCIKLALKDAQIKPQEIDAINGHLTATSKDAFEVKNWSVALNRKGENFPLINTFKSYVGHCLAAAGSIELVGTVLQLKNNVVYGNSNITSLHPDITDVVDSNCIPNQMVNRDLKIVAKASFGFGDVNACVILKEYRD
ncbi:3-oxoacyl-(acyl-carrier-protein) synthase [Nonlabens xylanidelens]|uniref:3-oxoacyl-[acyl-carrier-protein] synthase 1 n=1 Tax=Nonlabens xylanidelens TaxID=191564 RepID=A0A2S6IMT7_9FLAO|nr:beta-ketoacyl-[acyl-carrier-protein] synthase family protein [Nonlabens xylanidelens]PPK95528.1 3-oxoacyl-(acyl-carrier-protein) synthase [Nonlabens xylanidelens]PQJ22339.1 beta-ketoacyl-ACP synthase [Nonlabens xylanidelens]